MAINGYLWLLIVKINCYIYIYMVINGGQWLVNGYYNNE